MFTFKKFTQFIRGTTVVGEIFNFAIIKNYIKFKQVITMAYDLKKETDVKEYLDKLGIEYRFGCYSEKKADGNKKKLNFSLLHNLS